jgi:hypothetical protein
MNLSILLYEPTASNGSILTNSAYPSGSAASEMLRGKSWKGIAIRQPVAFAAYAACSGYRKGEASFRLAPVWCIDPRPPFLASIGNGAAGPS